MICWLGEALQITAVGIVDGLVDFVDGAAGDDGERAFGADALDGEEFHKKLPFFRCLEAVEFQQVFADMEISVDRHLFMEFKGKGIRGFQPEADAADLEDDVLCSDGGNSALQIINQYFHLLRKYYNIGTRICKLRERGSMEKNETLDISIRPRTLQEYIGQDRIKEMLRIFIYAARQRKESLDHVLFFGPPGLGKTTLAGIIAREMGANFHSLTAPSIERIGDMVAILTNLEAGDVLFIDEIHRLPRVIEEVLYGAMEDFTVNIIVGKDATSNTIRLDLPPFTLIGATTRFGDVSAPLRDRFGIVHQLHYYGVEELARIVKRSAKIYDFPIEEDAAREIAKRARGTPRIANRLYRRVRDFAQFDDENCDCIRLEITSSSLSKLDIDEYGLNQTDHRYLRALVEMFGGGPAGLNALAAAISEDMTTLEDVYEPYLLQEGFILRTPRGRMATEKTYRHLGIERK